MEQNVRSTILNAKNRELLLQYKTIPNTDLRISSICLGTAAFGSVLSTEDSFKMLDAYCAAGGNVLDTAHVYADWLGGERHKSEKTLGEWLRRSGNRERVVLSTKGGHPDLSTPLVPRLAPEDIANDLNESLDCLGVKQIDLYWVHRDDPQRPVAEIMESLDQQVRRGKVRYLGCSNWQPDRIRAAQTYARQHGLSTFVASQVHWSLAVANPGAFANDHALMDTNAQIYYASAGLCVMCYTSQARGFLSKAAEQGIGSLKPDLRRDFENAESLARLARAQTLAHRLNTTVSSITLAYIASQPFAAVPIIGPLGLSHLADSLRGSDLTLSADMLRFLATGQS
jgi:aryl-alcohol dehydrogenase-like predicted oxidoreductase